MVVSTRGLLVALCASHSMDRQEMEVAETIVQWVPLSKAKATEGNVKYCYILVFSNFKRCLQLQNAILICSKIDPNNPEERLPL